MPLRLVKMTPNHFARRAKWQLPTPVFMDSLARPRASLAHCPLLIADGPHLALSSTNSPHRHSRHYCYHSGFVQSSSVFIFPYSGSRTALRTIITDRSTCPHFVSGRTIAAYYHTSRQRKHQRQLHLDCRRWYSSDASMRFQQSRSTCLRHFQSSDFIASRLQHTFLSNEDVVVSSSG